MFTIEKEKLFEQLGKDFTIAVMKYRKAREDNEITTPHFWSEEKEDKYYEEEDQRKAAINNSTDYVKLTRVEFWESVLISKIQVIGAIDGFALMQEFSYYLRNIDTDELSLESAFCSYADGICGWCR